MTDFQKMMTYETTPEINNQVSEIDRLIIQKKKAIIRLQDDIRDLERAASY